MVFLITQQSLPRFVQFSPTEPSLWSRTAQFLCADLQPKGRRSAQYLALPAERDQHGQCRTGRHHLHGSRHAGYYWFGRFERVNRGKPTFVSPVMAYTGFDYEFNSLRSKEDEFSAAFRSLIAMGSASIAIWTIRPLLAGLAPILFKLVRIPFLLIYLRTFRNNLIVQPMLLPGAKTVRTAREVLHRIGDQLVSERKSALLREKLYGVKEKSDTTGRDLLTLLVRANLQDADGMSDADIRARKGSP